MSAENITSGLTPKEDRRLTLLLSKWTGGGLSTPVFTQIARIIPQPIVEVVLLRTDSDNVETLLVPRPEDDIVWPGMVHTPGCTLRATDYFREDKNPLNGAFERIQDEIGNQFASAPTFAGRLHRLVERGPEVVEVYVSGLPEGSVLKPGHFWYPVDELASYSDFMKVQLGHVNMAIEHYKNRLKPG